jgi:hypothetical protein
MEERIRHGVRQPQLPLLYVAAPHEHTKAVAAATALHERQTRFSTSAEFFEPKAIVLHTATSILAARAMFGM